MSTARKTETKQQEMPTQASAPAPANAQTMVVSASDKLANLPGSFRNAREITARLKFAADNYHLVSPTTTCGAVPEGCSVVLSVVHIDPAETYDVGFGKFAPSKTALQKIAQCAGISWDPVQSRRLDDGSHSHYCYYLAVGKMRHLDGTEVQLVGSKEMDLREGSAQVQKVIESNKKGNPQQQLRDMRAFILGHAETKAQLRAIRSMGVRSSYTRQELERPFVVARLMWTGQSDDPELRRLFAMKQADMMLGATSALYGGALPPAPTAPQPAIQPMAVSAPLPPPPVGQSLSRDFDSSPDIVDASKVTTRSAEPSPPSEPAIKFGRASGTPLSKADSKELEWYAEALGKSLQDPDKERFRAANEAELRRVNAELARREGGEPPAETNDDGKY